MNRTFSIVFIILVIIFLVLFVRFKTAMNKELEIQNFNYDYEHYGGVKNVGSQDASNQDGTLKTDNINGLDVTTIINKAISNNEKYCVKKDKDGYYDVEDTDCIEIYISLIVDEKRKFKNL